MTIALNVPRDDSAAEPEMLSLLFALVGYCQPRVIVEAGTYHGAASMAMAAAMDANRIRGHIWTADKKDYGQRRIIAQHKLDGRITCHIGDFEELFPILPADPDFAFLDSGPCVDMDTGALDNPDVAIRQRHYRALQMAPNGLIVVDDTVGLWTGKDEIVAAGLTLPFGRGVTLIRR